MNSYNISIVVLPSELISKFNKAIDPAMKMVAGNAKESRYLTNLRDFLLPLLMNGQVTVVPKSQ